MQSSLLDLKINGTCDGLNVIHLTYLMLPHYLLKVETPKMHANKGAATKKTPTYFCMQLCKKSTDFDTVSLLLLNLGRHMYWYEFTHVT